MYSGVIAIIEWMDLRARIREQGFAIVPNVLDDGELEQLREAISGIPEKDGDAVRARGGTYAIRNLLQCAPAVRVLVESPKLRDLAAQALGVAARPVRATLFDKTPDANWLVPWHQDVTIAVRERVEVPGFGPWSKKAGVAHVQPPVNCLEGLLAVRIQLDDGGQDNGPLRVIPGSHRLGRLSNERIDAMVAGSQVATCAVPCGGALLMKPLLLHASSASKQPGHRRVIHVEFASEPLPGGLRWAHEMGVVGSAGWSQ